MGHLCAPEVVFWIGRWSLTTQARYASIDHARRMPRKFETVNGRGYGGLAPVLPDRSFRRSAIPPRLRTRDLGDLVRDMFGNVLIAPGAGWPRRSVGVLKRLRDGLRLEGGDMTPIGCHQPEIPLSKAGVRQRGCLSSGVLADG